MSSTIFRNVALVASLAVSALVWEAHAQHGDWRVRYGEKTDSIVRPENSDQRAIERTRVTIRQMARPKGAPRVFREEMEWELARRIRLDEQTTDLIRKLETMKRDPRQQGRLGEINMRLAEYYYERAKITAAKESANWERQLKAWEELPEERKRVAARPVLRTPEANRQRLESLRLYTELERMSRGPDRGRAQMVQRDEVLFYLASTLVEVGRGKESIPFFEELLSKASASERSFAARLQLADLYFETGEYAKATPHYLQLATGRGAPAEGQHLKAYALYKLGWCYLNTSQADKAVLAFRRTLDASKENPSERRIVFEREAKSDLMRAYAMAGQYDEGEKFFRDLGDDNLLKEYYVTVADTARDRGDPRGAERFYKILAQKYPEDPSARDWALQRVGFAEKGSSPAAHAKALEDFVRGFGAGSDWLSAQEMPESDKGVYAEEGLSLLRREAKNRHALAQKQAKHAAFQNAEPYYASYFRVVPEPATDTAENVHDMRFFYGELLYKLGNYPLAAEQYAKAGEGKHAAEASFNRILALRQAAGRDKKYAGDLANATEAFIDANASDPRANDLLYASAAQAFDAGADEKSLVILRRIVERTPEQASGVESAERILFIHEKNKDFASASKDAEAFLANEKLAKAGGADFRRRMIGYRDAARFAIVDAMPADPAADKGRAYFELAKQSSGDLREKALNNALVFAGKAGDEATSTAAREMLLKEFPASSFAGNLYLDRADRALAEGQWSAALADYRVYVLNKQRAAGASAPAQKGRAATPARAKGADVEAATWNALYVRTHLEDIYPFRTFPTKGMGAELKADLFAFLADFPAAKNRAEAVASIAYQKDAVDADFAKLKALPRLSAEERRMITEGEALRAARRGSAADRGALLKRYPSASRPVEILRPALADLAFGQVQPAFDAYQKGKVDTKNDNAFVKTLNARIAALQKLEKDYLAVAAYGDGEVSLKIYERLARLYRRLAGDISQAPQLKVEEVKSFLEPQIKSLTEKADGFVRTCLDKAVEFKIGGAGLEACRAVAREFDPSLVTLGDDLVPSPRWISSGGAESVRPVLRVAREAFAQNRNGEFLLAVAIAEKAKEPLTNLERAEIDNQTGLVNVRFNQFEAAVKAFRSVADRQGTELGAVRTAALKNLAALYLVVGDYRQASETAGLMTDGDPDVAWIAGIAHRGAGRTADAVKAYESGLKKAPDNATLLFNLAVAHAAAAQFKEAAAAMQNYIERTTPPASHVSRQLYRNWRAKAP